MFCVSATPVSRATALSVACIPGNKLFIVTPVPATCLDVPATKPVKPARAELDSPKTAIGAFTDCEVIFTILPHP